MPFKLSTVIFLNDDRFEHLESVSTDLSAIGNNDFIAFLI